ncbi:hypothetical protein ACC862_24035 [Rhizobium ruizarguesonis]
MKRLFLSAFALLSLACVTMAPLGAAAYMAPPDPGITATTERVSRDIATPAVVSLRAEKSERERLRPTVVVYNARTCSTRVPDATGRLRQVTTHRTFAVPWINCKR